MDVSPELRPGQRSFESANTCGREVSFWTTLSTVNAVATPLSPPDKRHTSAEAIPTCILSASQSTDGLQRRETSSLQSIYLPLMLVRI